MPTVTIERSVFAGYKVLTNAKVIVERIDFCGEDLLYPTTRISPGILVG